MLVTFGLKHAQGQHTLTVARRPAAREAAAAAGRFATDARPSTRPFQPAFSTAPAQLSSTTVARL